MNHRYHLTLKSSNAKTGPIPVSTTSSDSCPKACPLLESGVCYAKSGPLALHWKKVDQDRGTSLEGFCESLKAIPAGTLFRHNQAGDLPGQDDKLDYTSCVKIAHASQHLHGFTYTHYPMTEENRHVVAVMNEMQFTVNISANSINEAVQYRKQGYPTVCVVAEDSEKLQVVDGVPILVCPAQTGDRANCESCRMCAIADRKAVIAFRAHGTKKKHFKE